MFAVRWHGFMSIARRHRKKIVITRIANYRLHRKLFGTLRTLFLCRRSDLFPFEYSDRQRNDSYERSR